MAFNTRGFCYFFVWFGILFDRIDFMAWEGYGLREMGFDS